MKTTINKIGTLTYNENRASFESEFYMINFHLKDGEWDGFYMSSSESFQITLYEGSVYDTGFQARLKTPHLFKKI